MPSDPLFENELRIIRESEDILAADSSGQNLTPAQYRQLLDHYQKLFRQFRRLIRMSDLMQNDLNVMVERIESATRAKSEFLARMSHEIRNPMNSILGLANLLSESNLEVDARKYVQLIQSSGAGLMDLVNDILDLAKAEAGMIRMEHIDFDLFRLVEEICDIYALRADRNGVSLTFSLAPQVPEVIQGDPTRLRQILTNLIGNAVKFTEQGSIHVEVVARKPRSESDEEFLTLQFKVTDTGIGIPLDRLPGIFERFSQSDSSTSRKYGGTGLGLSISKQLIELMKGKIEVQSEPGRGSTFSFTATFRPGNPDFRTSPGGPVPAKSSSPRHWLNIMVVEDQAPNLMVAEAHLKKMGHRVTPISNGREALDALKAGRFDLILLDLELPEMHGLEVAQSIRTGQGGADNQNVPIIALTAHVQPEIQKECQKVGINAFVSKPINFRDLGATIDLNLNKAALALFQDDGLTPQAPEKFLLDKQTARLNLGLDPQDFEPIFEASVRETQILTLRLRKALASSALDDAARYAHSLKSTADTMGSAAIRTLAAQIYTQAKAGKIETLPALGKSLEKTLAKVKRVIADQD